MANIRWKGGSAAVAQVTAYVFGGTWEATDVINVTIGDKTLSVVAGSTTITTIVDTVVTAFNALSTTLYPEFSTITASRSSNSLVLTADSGTEGIPFTCTVATTETGGGAADAQTIDGAASSTGTDSTACSGPNFWSTAKNWDSGTVPANSDSVFFENNDVPVKYGLAQSAVTLTALNIAASYTGTIGLPEENEDASASYREYRATYLAIGVTTTNIGEGSGQGSGRIKINFGAVAGTVNVWQTASSPEQDLEAVIIKGSSLTAVNVTRGTVGVAIYGGETATVTTLRVGYQDSVESDAAVRCGAGVTLTTLSMSGGAVQLGAGLTTVTKTGGTLTLLAGNVTTLTNDAGTVSYRGAGTITTLNVGNDGEALFTQDMRSRTVTDCNVYRGAILRDSFSTVTWTNPIRLVRTTLDEVDLSLGVHRTYAIAGP